MAYTLASQQSWINFSKTNGKIKYSEKVYVKIDWSRAPEGEVIGGIVIAGAGSEYTVKVPINNKSYKVAGFVEDDGVVSIEAANFQRAVHANDARWITVPNLGRTQSSVTPFQQTPKHVSLRLIPHPWNIHSRYFFA